MEANNAKAAGNAAAMREALEALSAWANIVKDNPKDKTAMECVGFIETVVSSALAAPPRNCDVGTAAEQSRRFCAFCRPRTEPCDGCSCLEGAQHGRCEFIWAQMPYEEGGAK